MAAQDGNGADRTPENVKDPFNMRRETAQIVDDLDRAINQELDLPKMEFDEILVCGMGGSAVGGDIVADCLYPVSSRPLKVVRFPELPAWASERSLVLVSSYSGNTRETIAVFEQAVIRGCQIIAITSGGTLMDRCVEKGIPFIAVKKGIQPRNAVGYTVGYTFNILRTIGGPDITDDIRKVLPDLRKYVASLKGGRDSDAVKAARRIGRKVPVIYSSSYLYSVAGRWRAQFNENSKLVAFDGHIPDTNHMGVDGMASSDEAKTKPVLLVEDGMSRMMEKLYRQTLNTLKKNGLNPYVINITGRNTFEKVFRATLLGDFISLELAFRDSKDPHDVSSISSLKERLSALLGKN